MRPIASYFSITRAATRFFEAYPHEEPDPFLSTLITEIANASHAGAQPRKPAGGPPGRESS